MGNEVRLSRSRLFVVLDAFERDMRDILEKFVLDHLEERTALGPDYDRADELRSLDSDDDPAPIANYLFLRQCYDVLNRNRNQLPGELAEELRHNTPRLDELVPLRNRVMHGRPLRGDDPEVATSILRSFQTRHWKATHETLLRLQAEVDWEPAFETTPAPSERVLHNLPLADYDETGLVGRSAEVLRLKALLQKRREPVITIAGEGGIGKTALALETAYAIVDDPASDFDCVLWVSLKNEALTASGVRAVENSVHGIIGAATRLGGALDPSFSGSIADLSEALTGLTSLLIIDNLESAKGEEILNLYDTLPTTVTYLFTSRVGVGQLERRVPLGALKPADAELLFRRLAGTRGVSQLSRLSSTAISQIVDRLRCSPLAIRWYVLSVEAGKEPISTLRDQRELIDFCIENVYEALGAKAKSVLAVLDAVDRSVSFDELAVLMDVQLDDLRRATQELSRGAMVQHEIDPNGGAFSRLSLSVAARMFLKGKPGRDTSLSGIQQREDEYRRSAERRKIAESTRRLGPGVVRSRTAEDEPVVHLLDLALSHNRRGEFATSQEFIARARALNPEYWEVDRVAGFIASSQRRGVEASALYKSAFANSQSDEERAIVAYFLAGHLARKMHDIDAALPFAELAHQHLNSSDTALLLGNLHVWSHRFAEGQSHLESALESSSGKTYLIAATALVESWRRWAESALEEHHAADAVEKAFSGVVVGTRVLDAGNVDLKLAHELVDSMNTCVRAMCTDVSVVATDKVQYIVTWIEQHRGLVRGVRSLEHLNRAFLLLERDGDLAAPLAARIRRVCSGRESTDASQRNSDSQRELVGEVISWFGNYGFIQHLEYPRNVFFHRGSLAGLDASAVTRGAVVSFDATVDEDDRARATRVALIAEPNLGLDRG